MTSDDETPADKVKKQMSKKRRVTPSGTGSGPGQPPDAPVEIKRGKRTLTLHQGGKADEKPKRAPRGKKQDPEPPSGAAQPEDEPPADDSGKPPDGVSPEALERAKECAGLDQNDRDNARRLIIHFGPDIAYVSGMGWLTWRGTHWQRDEGDLGARLMAQNLVDFIKLEAALLKASPAQQYVIDKATDALKKPEGERNDAEKRTIERGAKILEALSRRRSDRMKFAVSSGNSGKTDAMLKQAASLKAIGADHLDKDLLQFNCRNGTLRFVKRENPDSDPESPTMGWVVEFAPHGRDDMITKMAEVDYDATATCPLFEAFLAQTQPAPVMQLFIKVFHGYALLLGGNDEQKLVFHYGTGANGKSAFLETLGRLAGSYRAVVSPDTLTGETQRDGSKANSDIARLHSARLVTVEELPRNTPLKEGLIKSLTGGTRQVARFLQKEIFEFDPVFTAVMTGNDMPNLSGTDYGIWRRLLIAHWGVTIPEAERLPFGELMKRFDAERAGILNWLIAGALRYLNEGMGKFIPADVTDFTKDYREERDNVGVWAENRVMPYPGSSIKAGQAYKDYTEFCESNGLRAATQRSFGDRLNAMGFKKKRGGNYVYLDIAFKTVTPAGAAPPPGDPTDPGWTPPT